MLAAATNNFGGLFALRFLLGASEAPISPGMMMLTSILWTSEEAPLITSSWLAIDGVATIIGSLLAWGLGHTHSDVIPSWKFVFLVSRFIILPAIRQLTQYLGCRCHHHCLVLGGPLVSP